MADTTAPKQEDSVRQSKKKLAQNASTQTFLKIAEIRDNTVTLKNGGVRAVIKVSSINFNLKSEEEQNAIIYSYQGFLNTLDFPVQILIKSRKLDIDDYLDKLREKGEKQQNALLKEHTFEYIEYIAKLVEYADVMEKEFYVIVPYDPFRAQKPNILQKFFASMNPKDSYSELKKRHKEFSELKKKLTQRISSVKVGLQNCGLQVEQLNTQKLIELFYKAYNPTIARYQKIKDLNKINIETDEQKAALQG